MSTCSVYKHLPTLVCTLTNRDGQEPFGKVTTTPHKQWYWGKPTTKVTLSAMCTILIESFLPDAHQKYVSLNYMHYRSYKSHVPDYLRDRPSTEIHKKKCLTTIKVSL